MSDNENMENKVNTSAPKVVAEQGKDIAKNQVKKTINKAAGNAVRSWLLPILPWILGIAIALIVVAGIIMFFLSGIGLVFENIKTAATDFGHKVQAWWYGDQYVVTMQEIVDVADQLENMGYDLQGDGFLTGVITEDNKVANGLDRSVSWENVSVDTSGIARDEKGIVNIDSDYIRQYLISDNYMYTLYNTNGNLLNRTGFIKLYNDGGVIGNKGKLYHFPNRIVKALLTNIFSLFLDDSIEIQVNTNDKTLEIAHVRGVFWWKKVNTFKYSLEGWTGRYGMPLEFLLSVHLASMQPDLAYEMTTEFPTNVNMLLHPINCEIIGHIKIEDTTFSSGSFNITEEEWNSRKAIQPTTEESGEESGEGSEEQSTDEETPAPTPNDYDTHNYGDVKKALEMVYDSFDMYYPYIADVTDHWFRNAYLVIGDSSLKFIKNDQEFEYYTGERWTEYETETDADGNEHYTLYIVNEDGTLGSKYNGTVEQANKDGFKVSKKAKTDTIAGRELYGNYWIAYEVEKNAILISDTPLTPDVVGGEARYNSIPYHEEITYEAETSQLLRQVRDGERGETNAKIKKMLTQYTYYTYNGQRDRALAIEEDKKYVKENYGEYKHENAQGKLIDGTSDDHRDQNLVAKFSINADSLSAFKILENMNTLDADEIYRDFKELIVELNYFDKEYFAGNETDVFQWPIPDCGTAGWPVREIEKPINTYGTLINSRINLLNLKNLFLQYKQEDSETTGENGEPVNPMENQPATTTTRQSPSEGVTTDRAGNSLVDRNGYSTDAWNAQVAAEEERVRQRRENENYTPGEGRPSTQNGGEGTQGESGRRRASGGGGDPITEDFIKAEDESGAQGWYDTFDIVMENIDLNDANCPYTQGSERSYMSFLNSLGGVFAEYAGEENNGEGTYEDFMAGCQYVYGLATIFGFNYCAGDYTRCDAYQHGLHGGAGVATIQQCTNDAYHGTRQYSGSNHHDWWGNGSDDCDGCNERLMDDTMIEGKYCTNCNYTTDKVYYKAGLFERSDSSCAWGDLLRKYGGNYVYRIEELQVGDLIEHFDGGVWKHVSFVGEINDDEIVVYETGHGWISTGDFRFVYNRYTDSKPTGHDTWFGVHIFDLQPRNRDEYEGYDGNVDVVSPVTGEVIDAGEVQITNIQTNEIETVGYIKIRALMAEDIGSCIPDANIRNMEDPDTKVAKLKNGTSEEKKEFYYGGYKLFLQEYQNAKVTGFILYMEGFDLRLFEKDSSGKVKFKSRRSS